MFNKLQSAAAGEKDKVRGKIVGLIKNEQQPKKIQKMGKVMWGRVAAH